MDYITNHLQNDAVLPCYVLSYLDFGLWIKLTYDVLSLLHLFVFHKHEKSVRQGDFITVFIIVIIIQKEHKIYRYREVKYKLHLTCKNITIFTKWLWYIIFRCRTLLHSGCCYSSKVIKFHSDQGELWLIRLLRRDFRYVHGRP